MNSIKITPIIEWSGENYACVWSFDGFGAVIVTAETLDDVKKIFLDALQFQIEEMTKAGEDVPTFLRGSYDVDFLKDTTVILKEALSFLPLNVISKEAGIQQSKLENYVSGKSTPKAETKEKILTALQTIGEKVLALA